MAIWNGTKFVDALPQTQAAQNRTARRTVDEKPCGCNGKPAVAQRTHDALPLGDNRGFWRITNK